MAKQPTYRDFFKQFPDDASCLDHLKTVRYGEVHHCEKCGKEARFYRVKGRRSYACEHCGHHIYPMAGTPFENTRTSLQDWFFVMHLFCASRNGVSAKEVERQIGCTYKTAWRMCRLIREYMGEVDGDGPLGGRGFGPVESDEGYIGGKDKQGHDDKTIVLGMVERNGEIITRPIKDKKMTTIRGELSKHVNKGATVYTDEGLSYNALAHLGYRHDRVKHAAGEYVRGSVHINTIEGFWNLFKAAYRGTYVHVSPKYMQTYLHEFEFRWNLRQNPELMMPALLQGFAKPVSRTP